MDFFELYNEIEPSVSNTDGVVFSGNEELGEVFGEAEVTDISSALDKHKDVFGDTGAIAAMEAVKFDIASQSSKDFQKLIDINVSESNTIFEPVEEPSSGSLAACEDFSAQILDNHKPISTVVNAMAGSNKSLVEAIYPTIIGDAFSAGIKETLEFGVVNGQYLRSAPDSDNKDTEGALIKLGRKANNVFTNEILKLVPVLRTSQAQFFVTQYQHEDDSTGQAIQTAPLKFDVEIDYGAITQTDEDLLNGVRDQNFVLSGDVKLDDLYFTLNDADGNTSSHKYNLSLDRNARFIASRTGDSKDIILAYKTEEFIIDADTIKTIDNANSAVIDNLDIPGYKIYLKVFVNGQGNTRTNKIELNQPKFKLVKVIDDQGNVLPESDQKYTDIKDVVERTTVDGYELDVYTTNEDLRKTGIQLDVRTVTDIYNTRYTLPLYMVNSLLTKTTRSALKSINEYIVTIIEQRGIAAFNNYFNVLKTTYSNGGIAALNSISGITKNIIDPYFDERELALLDVVDSQESKDVKANVGGAISNNIVQMVNDMVASSGILDAAKKMGLSGAELVIVTDTKIATALNGLVSYDGLNVKIVASDHETFLDKVRFFITVNRTNELTELTWGFRGVTPTPVVTAILNKNDMTGEYVIVQPRMSFHNRLTLGAEIRVTGFDAIVKNKIKKLAQ